MSTGSFPVVLIIGRKGKGREEGRMDSLNTFTTQFSEGKDSEVLALLRLSPGQDFQGKLCRGCNNGSRSCILDTHVPCSMLSSLCSIAQFYNQGSLSLLDWEGDLPNIPGAQLQPDPSLTPQPGSLTSLCFVLRGATHVLSELQSFRMAVVEQKNPTLTVPGKVWEEEVQVQPLWRKGSAAMVWHRVGPQRKYRAYSFLFGEKEQISGLP